MSNKTEIKSIVEKNEHLREYLFTRGFIFTNNQSINANEYPFYGNWKSFTFGSYILLVDEKINVFYKKNNEKIYILIGHAYNPFDGVYDEDELIENLFQNVFFDYFNQWTGVFTLICIYDNKLEVFGDCAGMQANYYGIVNDNIYFFSCTTYW